MNEETSSSDKAWMEAVDGVRRSLAPKIDKESAKMDNRIHGGKQEREVGTWQIESHGKVKIMFDGFHYRAYDKDGKQIGDPRVDLKELQKLFSGKVTAVSVAGGVPHTGGDLPPVTGVPAGMPPEGKRDGKEEPASNQAEQEAEKDAQAVEKDVDAPPDPMGAH